MSDEEKQGTTIEFGGMSFTGGKAFLLASALSTLGGVAWGGFEFYNDYRNMKTQIQEYVTPDLSGINERLTALDKKMEGIAANVQQSTDYTNEIKIDLKADIRRVEGVVESVERSTKQDARDTAAAMKDIQGSVNTSVKEVQRELRTIQKDVDLALKQVEANTDKKIKQALDNPLNN